MHNKHCKIDFSKNKMMNKNNIKYQIILNNIKFSSSSKYNTMQYNVM